MSIIGYTVEHYTKEIRYDYTEIEKPSRKNYRMIHIYKKLYILFLVDIYIFTEKSIDGTLTVILLEGIEIEGHCQKIDTFLMFLQVKCCHILHL